MTQFKVTKPNENIRLRAWPPGRISQLRLMLSHFNTAINNSLAAQVAQSGSREFSQFVPKIPQRNIRVEVSYREIRIVFTAPRGLRKFLFYEMDVARNDVFNQFTRFQSPEPIFSFTALEPGVEFFFRIRVVTTDGEVGPFSDTFSQTALRARGSSVFDNREIFKVFSSDDSGDFQTLLDINHSGVGGSLFYMVNFEVRAGEAQDVNHNLSWTDLEFRWLENEKQVGQVFGLTAYSIRDPNRTASSFTGDDIVVTQSSIGVPPGDFTLVGPFVVTRSGTFSQFIHETIDGNVSIKLQARQREHGGKKDWTDNLDSDFTVPEFQKGYIITLRNFSSFEVIVDA
jgi:hypothetical protein